MEPLTAIEKRNVLEELLWICGFYKHPFQFSFVVIIWITANWVANGPLFSSNISELPQIAVSGIAGALVGWNRLEKRIRYGTLTGVLLGLASGVVSSCVEWLRYSINTWEPIVAMAAIGLFFGLVGAIISVLVIDFFHHNIR